MIAVGKEPVARIVPFEHNRRRRPGALKGRIALTAAFFEPLPADETAAWGEGTEKLILGTGTLL